MKLQDRLARVRSSESLEVLHRIDHDVFVLATNIGRGAWEPGGLFLVADEIRRGKLVEDLVSHSMEIGRLTLARRESGAPPRRESGVRPVGRTSTRALTIEDVRRLRVDATALRRVLTVALVARDDSLGHELLARLRRLDATLVELDGWFRGLERVHGESTEPQTLRRERAPAA